MVIRSRCEDREEKSMAVFRAACPALQPSHQGPAPAVVEVNRVDGCHEGTGMCRRTTEFAVWESVAKQAPGTTRVAIGTQVILAVEHSSST